MLDEERAPRAGGNEQVAGIEVDEKRVFNAGGTIEEGESAALQMLNEGTDVTAVQAAIPEDTFVIGQLAAGAHGVTLA